MASLEEHYEQLLPLLIEGRVIPLLGAGANRCGRPKGARREGVDIPDGRELADHLVAGRAFPAVERRRDLLRVSQFIAHNFGAGELYRSLHEVFVHKYPPTPLHELLASLPGVRRSRGIAATSVIMTTNYDDMLERAFGAAREPFDVVSYIADGADAGLFLHRSYPAHDQGADTELRPDVECVITVPNEYLGLALETRTVILKLHGAVDRLNPDDDSYVITEDDYIAYLTRTDLSGMLPKTLSAVLARRHFLFLGYSLTDWNLRAILHRIWSGQRRKFANWAIQLRPDELDIAFWEDRDVDIFDVSLDEYVAALGRRLDDSPAAVAS